MFEHIRSTFLQGQVENVDNRFFSSILYFIFFLSIKQRQFSTMNRTMSNVYSWMYVCVCVLQQECLIRDFSIIIMDTRVSFFATFLSSVKCITTKPFFSLSNVINNHFFRGHHTLPYLCQNQNLSKKNTDSRQEEKNTQKKTRFYLFFQCARFVTDDQTVAMSNIFTYNDEHAHKTAHSESLQ